MKKPRLCKSHQPRKLMTRSTSLNCKNSETSLTLENQGDQNCTQSRLKLLSLNQSNYFYQFYMMDEWMTAQGSEKKH